MDIKVALAKYQKELHRVGRELGLPASYWVLHGKTTHSRAPIKLVGSTIPNSGSDNTVKFNGVMTQQRFKSPPAIDYPDNHWLPPYEVPLEPNYFPGYNIETVWPERAFYGTPTYEIPN